MELKGRLKLIAKKVPKCSTVCDIGTDHAYIPIYLVLNNVCKKAVASDVKNGPVLAAKENIAKYKLGDRIETRLGNGLETISEEECDVIVIAGMGGELISKILSDGLSKAMIATSIILQPMNSFEILRKWLYDNGFQIYDEEMANEGEKIYNVISARWTGEKTTVNEIEYYIGNALIEKKDPLLGKYIKKRLSQLTKAIDEMQNASGENTPRLDKLKCIRHELLEILEKFSK